ncbi:protein FAR1-RELATED SEQUENCE 5-like [Trifolium pratense]|uniref:protein FAR1-RELATED SEQUENCE 5-like n=1 Tax=Trifolium pratense TaxID=57577 RepID=UPI001E693F02|nr:protein FAR1-RELATED SEQUENCE 5-like [Trifolium pratense]
MKPNIDEPDIAQPNVVEPTNILVNTANYFFKCEKYKVRDEMIEWCKKEAIKAGFTMVIVKSDNGSYRRKKTLVLGCSRGGAYKEPNRKLKKEDTATRKLNCPFRLRGYFLASEEWRLSVVCGEHNHKLAKNLEGHTLAGRLKPEEKECVQELSKNLVAPKNILSTLRGRNPDIKTSMKQIYNVRQRLKKDARGEMSELQQLMKLCENNKYFHKCRTIGDSTTIQDIFWAHPESVKLLNTFPTVLVLDSTYKTNK